MPGRCAHRGSLNKGSALTMAFPTARALLRNWRTTALVVLSIAMAIAVNSTVVSLLEALIFPKMDMSAPERLYWANFYGDFKHRLPAAQRDSILRSHGASFTLSTWGRARTDGTVLEYGDRFASVTKAQVGPAFFDLAEITPVSGRVLTAADTNANPAVVLLNQRTASLLFGGESPIGRTILSQGAPHRIVGVLGDRADFPNQNIGVWGVVGDSEATSRYMDRVIRIRDGYDRRQVERALDSAGIEVAALVHEKFNLEVSFRLRAAVETQFHYQRFHYAIAAGCIALLLIACANAANLELSRALARRPELAIRAALGASPSTLIRDALKEEVLLAIVAATAALGMTYAAARGVSALVPRTVGEFVVEPHVGWRVVTFAVLVALIATLLVGCAPAISSARADPQDALKNASGTGRSHRRHYGLLVVIELGLTIALCCGGIVMMRATLAVDAQPLGFDVAGRITGSLSQTGVSSARDAMEALRRRLSSVPGVASAAVTLQVPVRNHSVTVADSLGALVEVPAPMVHYLIVTPGYLETLGIPVALGSTFDSAVVNDAQIILDKKSAARLWPKQDPIGKRLKLGESSSNLPFGRVVGVIGDAQNLTTRRTLGSPPPEHTVGGIYYLPSRDDPLTKTTLPYRAYGFVALAGADAPQVVGAIRRALVRVDNAAGSRVELIDDALQISQDRASRRFLMQLFAFFALCGVVLSSIAVVSVATRTVMERRRELAVRRALGARAPQLLHVVLRELVPIALFGVALGLGLTKYAIPLLGSQALFDDRFNAPLFAATSSLVVVMLAGCLAVPAFQATRVPTSEALRSF